MKDILCKILSVIIFSDIFVKEFCYDYNKIFKIRIIEKSKISTLGFLYVNYGNFQNYSIFMNKTLLNWFREEKGKICESFNFDSKFSSIRFQILNEKSKAVVITETKPCCRLYLLN